MDIFDEVFPLMFRDEGGICHLVGLANANDRLRTWPSGISAITIMVVIDR